MSIIDDDETFEIIHETDDGLLIDGGFDEVWLPRSQVVDGDSKTVGDEISLSEIPEWLAMDRELI